MKAHEARQITEDSTSQKWLEDDAEMLRAGDETDRFWADLHSIYSARRHMIDRRIAEAAFTRCRGIHVTFSNKPPRDKDDLNIARAIGDSIHTQLVAGLTDDNYAATFEVSPDRDGGTSAHIRVRW